MASAATQATVPLVCTAVCVLCLTSAPMDPNKQRADLPPDGNGYASESIALIWFAVANKVVCHSSRSIEGVLMLICDFGLQLLLVSSGANYEENYEV